MQTMMILTICTYFLNIEFVFSEDIEGWSIQGHLLLFKNSH
jgi:hypothetical protein